MTLSEFHNALRILRSIDRHELVEAGVMAGPMVSQLDDKRWLRFRHDPYTFFIRADDETAAKLWAIIQQRMGR